jgi:glycerol-3-phosphate dehydrogenase (NAD(P)+)
VRLVGTHLDEAIVGALRERRFHPKLALEVPEGVTAFPNAELELALRGADALALGVSSAGVRWAAERLGPVLTRALPIAMVSKGLAFEADAFEALPDLFRSALPETLGADVSPVGIAGPCIAGELARRAPTAVVFTARALAAAEAWAELARTPYYQIWTSSDVSGVEACAALKNAYAMGMAFASGLNEKNGGSSGSIALHNYEAAVFAQSVWEMRRFVALVGGDPEQASWLPGVGDLNVTCNGGRTGRFGRLLGLGLTRDEASARMQGATLECLEILSTLREGLRTLEKLGRARGSDFPLAQHLAAVALDGEPVAMPFPRFFGSPIANTSGRT